MKHVFIGLAFLLALLILGAFLSVLVVGALYKLGFIKAALTFAIIVFLVAFSRALQSPHRPYRPLVLAAPVI